MAAYFKGSRWISAAVAVRALCACSAPDGGEGAASVDQRIIYGSDDRIEASQAHDPVAVRAAACSAALIDASRLDLSDANAVKISAPTLSARFGLCSGERFEQQITAASCSATLIAPDLVLTAGHCVTATSCGSLRVVFGYQVAADGSLAPVSAEQVHACSAIVARTFASDVDYAVVRLDRPVRAELPPLKVGKLPLAQGRPLLIAGNPSGLPLKVTGGAQVTDGRAATRDFFVSDLDSFPGNSGSGVFAADTGELLGVLARGPNPGYEQRPGESCFRPEQATPDSPGIDAVYLHHALAGFCAAAHDARLCACGDGQCDTANAESSATCAEDCGQRCGDGECNGTETGNGCYADCGACGNGVCEDAEAARLDCVADCGCPAGTVRDGAGCVAARGNVNGDEVVDERDAQELGDAVRAARSRSCRYAPVADVDCNANVDDQDAKALADFVAGRRPLLPCDETRALALGAQHTCALLGGGKVRCWGANGSGQLGLGTTDTLGDDEPIADSPPVALGEPATQIAAGATHTCALLQGGRVRCWGEGASGKLGLGDSADIGARDVPSSRPSIDLGARAIQVAAGGSQTCAVLENGHVRCWGDNQFGQLGTGKPVALGDDELPTSEQELDFGARITQLALGFDHSCALASDGSVRCWGGNLFGQLGRGDLTQGGPLERATQAPVVALGGRAKSIYAGPMTSCALREDDAVLCWGQNFFGELGYGGNPVIGDDEQPLDVGPAPLGSGVLELTLGQNRTCARYTDGSLKCWGANFFGELGYGNTLPLPFDATPQDLPALELGARALHVVAGFGQTCAIVTDGRMRCWGVGESGQLGYGSTRSVGADDTPVQAGDVPMTQHSDPRFHFVNPFELKVWRRQHDDDKFGENLGLFVENSGRTTLRNWRALLSFSAAEQPGATPVLSDLLTIWSRPSLHTAWPSFNVTFDFYGRQLLPGRSSSGGAWLGEHARVAFLPKEGSYRSSNDYSSSDQVFADSRSTPRWHESKRVQLVDEADAVIYGYTIR